MFLSTDWEFHAQVRDAPAADTVNAGGCRECTGVGVRRPQPEPGTLWVWGVATETKELVCRARWNGHRVVPSRLRKSSRQSTCWLGERVLSTLVTKFV